MPNSEPITSFSGGWQPQVCERESLGVMYRVNIYGVGSISSASARNQEPRIGGGVPVKSDWGRIQLDGVSVVYPGSGRPVLSDVSVELARGISYGRMGPSGAGKSSLVDILLGLLQPTAGRILVNGVPLDCISRESGSIASDMCSSSLNFWLYTFTPIIKDCCVGDLWMKSFECRDGKSTDYCTDRMFAASSGQIKRV